MYPVNQVFLGNPDPLLASDITDQLQRVKAYESQLMQLQKTASKELIWDSIDNEMNALTESQKNRFFEDKEYSEITTSLQKMVQIELLNLVKAKIENTQEGKELSQNNPMMALIKPLASRVIDNNMYKVETLLKQISDKDGHPNG